jgi:hypothetical protein
MILNAWKASIVLMVLAVALGCSTATTQADGDSEIAPDGDLVDGDIVTDGDNAGDGDVNDGDVVMDGDMDNDTELDEEPVACSTGDIAVRELPMVADDTFDLGPYVMNPQPDAMTILWRSEKPGNTRVFYGESPETVVERVFIDESVNVHGFSFGGLTPNTRYFYKVQTGATVSKVHSFYTSVAPGQPFPFVVWGDNQNGPEIFSTIVAQMARQNPYILVGVGDHVEAGQQQELWKEQLFDPARALFHERPFFPALGSHEENASYIFEYYDFPHAADASEDTTYSFAYGNAFFLVIDVNKVFYPIGELETDVSTFIAEAVSSPEAQAATWRFVIEHESGISEGWSNGTCWFDGNKAVRGWLLPLMAENRFHALFSGHTHGYERAQTEGGVLQLITGGGGGGLDAWCRDLPETTVAHYEHHFLKVTAGCESLKIEALYPDGERFDWVELAADQYGVLVDQGPVEDLPSPTINSAAEETPGE